MFFRTWRRWLNSLSPSSRVARRRARPRPTRRLHLEGLEDRVVPATRVWTGLGLNSLWTTPKNWAGNVAPAASDDLLFPTGASQLSNFNNYSPYTFFRSITLTGGAYSLTGNPISLGIPSLGGSITDSSGSVTNTISLSLFFQVFPGLPLSETFNVGANTVLTFSGQFAGTTSSIQVKKVGEGTVIFAGDDSGFAGPVNISTGTIQIQNKNALGNGTNTTTVSNGAALQVKDAVGTIHETLNLTGNGPANAGGALENVHGFNTIAGNVTLTNTTTIGADAGQLTLTGVVQGPATSNLVVGGTSAEDGGRVVLTSANTYTGLTVVNHGTLNLQATQALGPVSKTNGTTVGSEGALELQLANAAIVGQKLTLNGTGINNGGALRNISGNNTWDGDIVLASDASIGVDTGSTLTIGNPTSATVRGVISENGGSRGLGKAGNGELILVRKNTYSGVTIVGQGILTAENNAALGGGGNTHSLGARVIGNATLQLKIDPTTGKSLTLNLPLELNGPGVNRLGALNSATGTNIWQGDITLATDASAGANVSSTLYLGDLNTGAGTVLGPGGLTKQGAGTVVLPNANSYLGTTTVVTGVLEVHDSLSLGGIPATFATQSQAGTTVANGAALWVVGARQRDQQGGVTITEPLSLAGTGVNATGALYNVSGTNLLSGNVTLTGNTNVGVAFGIGAPNGSELTLSGDVSEAAGSWGLKKVGAGRLIVSGYNLYSGLTEVAQGVLTVASSNALGGTTSGTQVDNRAALELKGGIQVINEALSLTGTGVNNSGSLFNVSDDNRWTGPILFNSNVVIGAATDSRLTLRGNISDHSSGFSLTKAGAGKLVLGGVNAYSGGTLIQAGIVNVQNNAALGTSLAGTTVQNGAALELQTGVSINNQRLTVAGNGPANAEALPGGGEWFPVGPAAVTTGSTGITGAKPAVVSGRILGIAADPHDPNLIYLATGSGGVWRTKNGGQTWVPLTDNLPTLFTNTVAVSPSNPNIIYVGTGNADWDRNNISPLNFNSQFYGRGVLKSTDGGATWQLITGNAGQNEFDRQEIERILIDPKNPDFVYLGTAEQAINGLQSNQSGVWMTSNGGTTWTNTTMTDIAIGLSPSTASAFTDLAFDPATLGPTFDEFSRHIYVAVGTAVGDLVNGLWETTDSGAHWKQNKAFSAGSTKDGLTRLSVSPFPGDPNKPNSAIIYALVSKADGTLETILTSVDGGITFATIQKLPPDVLAGGAATNLGNYDAAIAVDPHNLNRLYVGGTSGNGSPALYESPDNGATWIAIDVGADSKGPHTNHHALTFDAFGRLLDGNDGGLWRLDSPTVLPTFTVHWTDLNNNLGITQFDGVAINPQNPNVAYGGSQGDGFEKFSGAQATGGLAWAQQAGGDVGAIGIDLNNPNTVYRTAPFTLTANFFLRSDNGGQTFVTKTRGINVLGSMTPPPDNGGYYTPFVVDPVRTTRLVLGTDRIYESTNRGDKWTALSAPNQDGWNSAAPIEAVAVAASDPNVIYAAVGSQLFVTFSHGQKVGAQQGWTEVDIGKVGHLAQIWVDPNNALVAYAVRNTFDTPEQAGRVFRTIDGGAHWRDISSNLPDLPVWSILIDDRPNQHTIYVGTDAGVYSTPDLGKGTLQWAKFGTGLPNTQVRQILLDPVRDYLAVGTHGRGLWELELDPALGNGGVVRGLTGTNAWTGSVTMVPATHGAATSVILGADFDTTVTFSGTLSDSFSGTGLTKAGPGRVELLNPDSYSGPTVINEGTLSVADALALGSNRNVTVQTGGSLELNGDGLVFTKHLTLNGPGTTLFPDSGHDGALVSVNGNDTWSGPITLGSDAAVGAGGSSQLTISGVIDDTVLGVSLGFSLSKLGAGEVVLTQANTYSGATTVGAGDLNVQNVQALGTGQGPVTVLDGAALWLQFPVLNNPPVALGEPVTPDNILTNQTLRLNGTGVFGLGALRNVSGNNQWPGTIILDSPAAIGVDDDGSGLTADGGSPLTLSGAINDGGGAATLTKVGVGTLILTHANGYTGGTEVAQGVLNIQDTGALGAPQTGFVTQVDDQAALELQFIDPLFGPPTTISGEPLSLIGSGINGGGALRNVSGNNVWAGPISVAATSAIGVENDPNNPTPTPLTLTVTGDVSGLRANELDKVGPGTLVFPAANDYAGPTGVVQGILQISDSNALGSSSGVFVFDGATLQLSDGGHAPITVTGILLQLTGTGVGGIGALENLGGSNTWDGPIALGGNASIRVAGANDTLTIVQTIGEASGGSNLTTGGPGTLVYAGAADNGFTGSTFVTGGRLLIDGAVLGAVVVSAGRLGGTGSVLGGITVSSGGTLAPGDLAAGTLTAGSPGLSANVSLAAGATLSVQLAAPGVSSQLQVDGNLTLNGAGLDVSFALGYLPAVGDSFTLIQTTGTLTGTFNGLANGGITTIGGRHFVVTYTANSVVLTRVP